MNYERYRDILAIETWLQSQWHGELGGQACHNLTNFNQWRSGIGVKTSLGSDGRIGYEPHLWRRFRNFISKANYPNWSRKTPPQMLKSIDSTPFSENCYLCGQPSDPNLTVSRFESKTHYCLKCTEEDARHVITLMK